MTDPTLTAALPIEPCGHVGKLPTSPESYRHNYRVDSPTMLQLLARADAALEDAFAKDKAIHEANAPAVAHNKALRETITTMMKAVGVPVSWSDLEFPSSRSRYKKRISKRAGYLTDLERWIPVADGFAHQVTLYETAKRQHAEYRVKAEQEQQQVLAAKEREAQARKANLDLARIIVRYGLPEESDWSEVVSQLRGRNKYLDLAVAMYQTRCDWSDGPRAVRNALERFTIENDRDKNIAADVADSLAHWDGDGRIFRDTTWSYGALWPLVGDEQLVADVQRAMQEDD
ncbi:hypothetical protein [Azospirillum himalayense]|uniref:Uncharacterized protein n=1 Tax=Azospirillum himalayense TaxID=654847 RepID=A0ABW0GBX7_9PROT